MLKLSKRFPRKRAFITGAASGLGEALARQLANDGWNLALVDVQEEKLKRTADVLRAQVGASAEVTTYVLDVTNADAYGIVVDDVTRAFDGIDLVFNNAGVAGSGEIGEYTLQDWDWLLDINVRGVVHGCHLFTPVMKRQRSGWFINTASAAALFPVPEMAAYCLSKSAVLTLSEVQQSELASFGIGVSCVMPEFFQTNLTDTMRGGNQDIARAAMKRSGKSADDVASFVLEEVGKGRLHLVYPRYLRPAWFLRRVFPVGSQRIIRLVADAQKRQAAKAKRRST